MATYGLQVFNTDGIMTIDENFSTLQVVASGTATTGQVVNFPAQTNRPLIMVSVPYGRSFLGDGDYEFSYVSINPRSQFYVSHLTYEGGAFAYSYKVLVPRTNFNPSDVPWGLRVYNPSIGVTFDSGDLNTLRVLKFATGTSDYTTNAVDDGYPLYINIDASKFTQRVVTPNGGANDDAEWRWYGYVAKVNSRTSVSLSQIFLASGQNYPVSPSISVNPQLALILGTFI